MKKLLLVLLLYLCQTSVFAAEQKPANLFLNISTVQEGTSVNLRIPPDEVTWTVKTFGNLSSWDITLDAAIDTPCDTAVYSPISEMTEASDPLMRGVNITGEKCFKANLKSISGSGGIESVKIFPRGQ